MAKKKDYDFSGWATKANILCSDGRTIMPNAFADCDGKVVPLVWNHGHSSPDEVLGHALLENRAEGVYMYGSFNNTDQAKQAKMLVEHGDISSLSIYANQLKQQAGKVVHGLIREVSLVLAGANQGATIDSVITHGDGHGGFVICHADESSEEAIIWNDDDYDIELAHSDEDEEDDKVGAEDTTKKSSEDDETVEDVINSMTKKQQNLLYALVGEALGTKTDGDDEEEGDDDMKHNVFDNESVQDTNVLSHSDEMAIMQLAKRSDVGSFKRACEIYAAENDLELQHGDVSGFAQGNISQLFPEYHDVKTGAPELITNDQGWINEVMNGVHKSPFTRIRTGQVDIRKIDALRAKGYQKGNQKKLTGTYDLVRRTTDPQTVYVKSALNRDDTIDITDFEIVDYQYNIDKMQLNEELATAIMFGDGRQVGDEDKIAEDKIRPIWLDDELFTIHKDIDIANAKKELQGANTGANFGENYIEAEAMVNTILYALEDYKGSGNLSMYIAPHDLNVMLLARDLNGRRIYSSKEELKAVFNVKSITTVEQMNDKTRKDSDGKTKKLSCLLVNLGDYSLGANKGGEVTHFTDFDIDFNQLKSLLETRVSGALTRIKSAIAIEKVVENVAG